MRYRFNWRFILAVTAVTAACLVAVHFTHRWQVRRQVGVFLREADAARDAKDADREKAYLQRYLMARPAENDVRERLGRLICNSAKNGREMFEGYLLIEDTLRRDPGRDELRRFAIDFILDRRLGDLTQQALDNIEVLLQKTPGDGELELLKARGLVQGGKFPDAEAWYKSAAEHRPDLVYAYAGRAEILRLQLKKAEEADAVVAEMLKNNPGNFRAHLLVAEYWRTFWPLGQNATVAAKVLAESQGLSAQDKVSQAISSAVAQAQKLAPDELDVVLALSSVSRFRAYELARGGNRDGARAAFAEAYRILKEGRARHPKSPAVYRAMASLEAEQKQEKKPVEVIKEGLEEVPGDAVLTEDLLDYQIRAGDAAGAAETLQQLKGKGLTPEKAELQQGRILMLKGEWLDATQALERARTDSAANPSLVRWVNLFLGRCYDQLGLPDRALDAFNRAVPVDMTDLLWVLAMQGVAESQARLGKAEAALEAYTKLKERTGSAWLPIARFRFLKALLTPADRKPDWAAVEEAVGYAEKVSPDGTDVRILRANVLNHSPPPGNPGEARKRLEALKAERPKEAAVWVALAGQDQRDGNPQLALATLAAGEKEAGDSPELRLARARIWVGAKEPDLAGKLEKLADAGHFTAAQQAALLRGLADLAAPAAPDAVARLWDRLAVLRPYDLGAHTARFDLALRGADEGRLEALLGEIRRVDGEEGSSARLARAALAIWKAQKKNDQGGLDEAMALLAALERERAGWGRVALAQALILDLKGHARAALAKYQQAVELGESNPDALRRLLELLRAFQHFEEAAAVLQKLPKAVAAGGDVRRLAAEVALRTNDLSQAVAQADQAVSQESREPGDYIWQGQVYYAAGQKAKAEAAFNKAAALRPESPDGWLVLLQFLAAGRREEAVKLLGEAKPKIAPDERSLFWAMGLALVGKSDEATAAFKQARAERPSHLPTLRAEADFLFRSRQPAEAVEAFTRIVDHPSVPPADKDFAKQMIALCLALDRDYATSRQALAKLGLLDGDQLRPLTGNETPAERRSRLLVLAVQRDRASRLEAIRILEADPELSPNDQFLLAQLHMSVGNRQDVRRVMLSLLQKNDRVALFVRFYATWLLSAGEHQAAGQWVARLASLQPDDFATAELQARLAAAQGKLDAARAIIVSRADAADAPLLRLARLCEDVRLYPEAERFYQKIVDQVREKQPQAPLLLAEFYGRRGRVEEALRICDELRKGLPMPLVGRVAVEALYATPAAKPEEMRRVAGWLDDAQQKAQGETRAALIQLLASVRNLQGDYAASMALYRDALRANSRDALAMNNLAYLVSMKEGKHDEALQLLARAKAIAGPLPDLLDTEALVLLNKKDFAGARRLLEGATAEAPTGAGYFHLAQVELAAGNNLEARQAWKLAQERGIRPADLHPLEQPEYQRLKELFR